MKPLFEVCCGSVEDVENAIQGGADRVELNYGLSIGGLTPSLSSLKMCLDKDIKVAVMVRPRAAGFHYNEIEKQVMFLEAEEFLKAGAHGVVFGFLNEDFTIDKDNTKKMVDLIHSYHKEAIFHRAFDVVNDFDQAMSVLIECGVDRVLTSGCKANAFDGIDNLKHLQETYGDQIEILAGCGVNPNNAKEILEKTGVKQLHSSCKSYAIDPTSENHGVSYNYLQDGKHEVVDLEIVRKMRNAMNEVNV